jgi:proline dehydrogenase
MFRRVLHAASRSDRARDLVAAAPGTRHVVRRFVTGERPADALAVARTLAEDGITASVGRLGGGGADLATARETTVSYLGLLDLAEDAGVAAGLDISLQLSSLGRDVPYGGRKVCYENAAEICARADHLGATVTLDAEEHPAVDTTLQVLADLRREYPTTGVALQAYLRRTEADCRELATARSRVRLCKGGYSAPRHVAFTRRAEIDISYARCLDILMAGSGYPMVATHDPRLLAWAAGLATDHVRAPATFEYQFLHGVRAHEQLRLVSLGATVRVYLPYGPGWYPYLLRRIAEHPANLALFPRALAAGAGR